MRENAVSKLQDISAEELSRLKTAPMLKTDEQFRLGRIRGVPRANRARAANRKNVKITLPKSPWETSQ